MRFKCEISRLKKVDRLVRCKHASSDPGLLRTRLLKEALALSPSELGDGSACPRPGLEFTASVLMVLQPLDCRPWDNTAFITV